MSIRILLADDHTITRRGLWRLLEGDDSFTVIGEAEDGLQAVELYDPHTPDVLLMDIAMPLLNGIEATRRIVKRYPTAHILMLSMHSDKEYVVRCLEAGAVGYLLKDCDTEELMHAVRTVHTGKNYVSPDVSKSVVEKMLLLRHSRTLDFADAELSPREIEVLQQIAEEKSSKEIAAVLDISIRTVENHRRQIMDKLDVRSIAGLTKYAIKKGIVSLD